MKSKSISFTISKLILIFSFLLFVPEVHLPDTTADFLSKITKLEIPDLVLNAPAKSKGTQSQKIKKQIDTKYFAGALTLKKSPVFKNHIFPDISLIIQFSCYTAVLARAPPLA